jgi:hypothetical protein
MKALAALSLIVAGALIAAAILIANRWEIAISPRGVATVVRLDRWTGRVNICDLDTATIKGSTLSGATLTCSFEGLSDAEVGLPEQKNDWVPVPKETGPANQKWPGTLEHDKR